ncbi:sulfatase [Paenibacillus koleovorans]|uniref:sulfatase n=1 Tax=Paenibacillus koleovorans TaxID=121608 RepID=UPI000FD97786|nr:sulfatase [Paenibacillus koleovorans]
MTRPNIICILIDDMGWKDLGCYGSSFYETPNLDRLAAEGMRFTDAYAACPVCSPTRASLMTGQYPAVVGITNFIGTNRAHPSKGKLIDVPYLKQLPLEKRTIATSLREEGYQTWHVGKWHLGEEAYYPDRHGFDLNIGGCGWGLPMKGYFSPYGLTTLEDGPEGEYLTDRLTDEAIRLLQERDADRPFFLNLWHYAVHTPIQAKPDDVERFQQKATVLGLDQINPFEEGELFPTEHKRHLRVTRRRVQSDPAYAAMVYNLDWNVGRLLDALERSGASDNTLVVFTSDNGGLSTSEGSPTSNAPLHEGKGWMYEGGTREPLLVRWPDVVPAGVECSVPITTPDWYPTFLEAAGIDPADSGTRLDGVSLLSLLRQPDAALQRDAIFWHYPHYGNQGGTPGSSVRMGGYKLIEFFEDGRLELYNLAEDLEERHNLAAAMPEVAARMQRRLAQWRASVEALIPEPNPDWPSSCS